MDSGLARFAVLIVLFFLLTGDLSGMIKHLYEDAAGLGGKQQRRADDGGTHEAAMAKAEAATEDSADGGSDPDIEGFAKSYSARMKLVNVIKESCLPKLICELTASANQDSLTDSERNLLSLIKDTTISTTAEVTSKYHFAAHMGQLINGIDNAGCHNFYPGCPFPGLQVMQMMKKVKIL
ncbi:Hypothetical protein CINCED_3A021325 [Cinara cedri]|uniref:Uncharacterized protein n=1 Tax=Cinara cedri TaxID=506608 RepID=A0A5E4N180_9HEMI|nr:Hypothetical protein CINCED_3A021325 [Cinara cedri]